MLGNSNKRESEKEERVLVSKESKEIYFCTNNLFSMPNVQEIDFLGVEK